MNGASFIVPAGPNGDYIQTYIVHEGNWGRAGDGFWDTSGGPCYPAFPTGWGGDVTDSMEQMQMAVALGYGSGVGSEGAGVFIQGIGTYADIEGVNPSKIKDTAWYVVCGDGGAQVEFWDLNGLAFPDYCRANACGWCAGTPGCCAADWENCPLSQDCGVDVAMHRDEDGTTGPFWTDGTIRKGFGRHLGGSNVGFADGHAKWFLVDSLINAAAPVSADPKIENLCGCIPTCEGPP
jgi:prepilin-type processing-associated H-X9-DG protein